MKRKPLTKTRKLNEAEKKRLKEDLCPREEKQNLWETYKYVARFIDLSYVSSSWQMAAKCVKKKKYHWSIMKMRL